MTYQGGILKALLGLFFFLAGEEVVACKPQINWNDTITFCQGNSITMSAHNPNSTYYWSTGATTSSITVNSTGTYWVTVTNPCGSTSDTIHVSADQPLFINLGNDRKMCSAGNTILSVPYDAFSQYRWQDGSSSHRYNVTQTGTYWVEVTNGCGTFTDTVHISLENPPSVNLGPDINDCSPAIHTFNVSPPPGASVQWSTGSPSSSIIATNPGTYWVKLTNSCGSVYDTITVTLNQGQNLEIGDTIFKCGNGTATISANVSGGNFLWSNTAASQSIVVQNPGLYWLQYTDACGTYSDSVYVVNSGKANVDLGPDTALCEGDYLILDAGNMGSQFFWHDGSKKQTFWVDTAGTYWVDVDNGCGSSFDTINVTLKQVPDTMIADTVYYCQDSALEVDAGNWGPSTSYFWDDGSTTQKQIYNSSGAHWVEVGNDCDTVLVNFQVLPISEPSLDLGKDTVLCEPEYRINSGVSPNGNSFMWSTGEKSPSIAVNSTGNYWVEVTNACGVFTDTVSVEFLSLPQLPKRTMSMCVGNPVTFGYPLFPETSYQWNTGDTTHEITVNQAGIYILTATNVCGTVYDTVEVTSANPINVDLGADTVFCEPGILYLDVSQHYADSIYWSTGSRNGGLPVGRSGSYWVELFNPCGVFSDTIQVQIDPLPDTKLADAAICIGDSVKLDVSQSQVQDFQWNTGDSTSSIWVSQTGWYYVDMTNQCGTVRDSAYLRVDHPVPNFDLGKDTIFCQGSLILDPGHISGATYSWQNGVSSRTYIVTKSGEYYVTATNACNSYTDTINVLITGPPQFVLGEEVRLCSGTILTLNAQNPGSEYLWNTGDSTQTLNVDSAGTYWVLISNDCGELTDTVDVIVEYPMNDLNLGPDTVICRGEQLPLFTKYPGARALWSTGATSDSITVQETGTYGVQLSNSCGVWSDSIYVEVLEVPEFSLGDDSVICAIDGRYPISGPEGLDSYQWSNGDSSRSTVITEPGTHWLKVGNKCFSYTDTIYLKDEYPIEMDLGEDIILCFGESVHLNPGDIDYPVSWSNGKTAPSVEITRSGTYWARTRNSCGTFSDTLKVEVHYPLDNTPLDTTICRGDSAVVDISESKYSVLWQDGETEEVRYFKDEGSYFFTIYNKCGAFPREFIVKHSHCDCPFFIANAFTPNDDGANDEFKVVHNCPLTRFRIRIMNRWGEVVYENDDIEQGWDGTMNGKPMPMGTYYYRIEYGWDVYGLERIREKQGVITLIR